MTESNIPTMLREHTPDDTPSAVQSSLNAVERFQQHLRTLTPRVVVTPVLVVVNVLVFGWMLAQGVDALSPNALVLLDWGGSYAPAVSDGEWWRMWTANYLHAGVVHIAFNMWILWDAGRSVERMVGSAGFLAMYTIAGILGSVAGNLMHPQVVSVGASGAVFGVFGCLLAVVVRMPGTVGWNALGRLGRDAGVFIGFNVLFAFGQEGIDMAAHIGGLAAGFLCGLLLVLPLERESLPRRRGRALLLTSVGAVAIVASILLSPAVGPGFTSELRRFIATEQVILNAFNSAIAAAQTDEISDAETADVIERDVLTRWRSTLQRLQNIDRRGMNDDQENLYHNLIKYSQLREQGWVLIVEAFREGDMTKAERANEIQARALEIINNL